MAEEREGSDPKEIDLKRMPLSKKPTKNGKREKPREDGVAPGIRVVRGPTGRPTVVVGK